MDPRIARVIARMEATIGEPVTINDLGAFVNLSGSRLAHLFKREVGVAPARYLHRLRMERARLLLDRTFLTVKQVMACVGVNDPSHFARDFRRYHGVPPSVMRGRATAADRPRWPQSGPTTGGDGQST
jgi:transcriptional regulator GlxA family with amidase domain